MRILFRIRLGLLVLVSALACSLTAVAEIQSIGIAGDGEYTRLTIASTTPLSPQVRPARENGGAVLEWHQAGLSLSSDPYLARPVGGIAAYTLRGDGILFELDRPMMVTRELDLPPTGEEHLYRYIVDLSGVSEARFDLAVSRAAPIQVAAAEPVPHDPRDGIAPPPSAKPASFQTRPVAAARKPYVVVIDPGHGGKDPGALSVIGGKEKDVVLSSAKFLAEELRKDPRYTVYMTRDDDTYVEHEDRVTLARNWRADLFISLHADAAGAPTIRGASVYTISTRGERRIDGTANKYGWEIPIEVPASEEVSGILVDLVKRETKSNSAIFAELLLPELAQAGPLLRNSHRQGNLFVLLAPDVPAVLIEIGFLTNRDDAKRLASTRGQRKSASAIKRGIDAYFDRQEVRLAAN